MTLQYRTRKQKETEWLLGKLFSLIKVALDQTVLEEVSDFNYLYFQILVINIWNEIGQDVVTKFLKLQVMCGIIHMALKNKTRQETRIIFYETMSEPVFYYLGMRFGCL